MHMLKKKKKPAPMEITEENAWVFLVELHLFLQQIKLLSELDTSPLASFN